MNAGFNVTERDARAILRREAAAEMKSRGLADAAIARSLGCSSTNVPRMLRRYEQVCRKLEKTFYFAECARALETLTADSVTRRIVRRGSQNYVTLECTHHTVSDMPKGASIRCPWCTAFKGGPNESHFAEIVRQARAR